METKSFNIWIIDDHPLIRDGYIKALAGLRQLKPEVPEFVITELGTIDSVFTLLKAPTLPVPDLIFLDIMFTPVSKEVHLSGEDLGPELRRRFPDVQFLIITSISENYRIRNIFSSLKPQGFILKSDVDFDTVIAAVSDLFDDIPYYSASIRRCLKRFMSHQFILDQWDRKLLYELSRGTRMIRMTERIPLSKGAIEKRKRLLKVLFDVEGGDDLDLLDAAREFGFVD